MRPGEQRPYVLEEHEVTTKMTPAVQRATDRAAKLLFLWAFPQRIRPNHLTVLRLLLIPVVIVLLEVDQRWWAFGVFSAAVCTDFIDGAMARTRNQITILGTYLDPAADKLLIGIVLGWVGWRYLIVDIILAFIVLELIVSAIGARILLRTGTARSSNAFGKSKMAVQSIAVFLFLLASFLRIQTLTEVSVYLLWLALALALASGITQVQGVIKNQTSWGRQAGPPPAA